jgi:hypothetical protein
MLKLIHPFSITTFVQSSVTHIVYRHRWLNRHLVIKPWGYLIATIRRFASQSSSRIQIARFLV